MSAPFIIPFNFQPVTTSVKTSSYTVPAGKYAKVVPSRADFTINGSSLSSSESATVVASGSSATTFQIYVQANSLLTQITLVQLGASNNTTGSISVGAQVVTPVASLSRTSTGTSTQSYSYEMGSSLYTLYASSTAVSGSATFTVNYSKIFSAQEIWVPSGTVLAGTMYSVTEYNTIS
jgi:hypothetical protein